MSCHDCRFSGVHLPRKRARNDLHFAVDFVITFQAKWDQNGGTCVFAPFSALLARSADEENAGKDEDEEDEEGEEGPSQRSDAHDEDSEELVLNGVKRDFLRRFSTLLSASLARAEP